MKLIIKNDNRDIVKNPNIKIIETTEASFTNQTVFVEENDVPIIKYTDTESMYFIKNLDNLYDRKSKSEILLNITIDNLELINNTEIGPQGPPGDINSTGGNIDTLGGVAMRTLYSKNDPIEYVEGVDDINLLKSAGDFFGSPQFPLEFFEDSVNYDSKTIHFRITGRWADLDATPNVNITIKFGNDVLFTTNFTGVQANNHPAEIMGEIMFTEGNAYPCCSMSWCENNGTMRRWALSEPTARDVTAFEGGHLQVIMNPTTTNSFTSYLAYVQVWN